MLHSTDLRYLDQQDWLRVRLRDRFYFRPRKHVAILRNNDKVGRLHMPFRTIQDIGCTGIRTGPTFRRVLKPGSWSIVLRRLSVCLIVHCTSHSVMTSITRYEGSGSEMH